MMFRLVDVKLRNGRLKLWQKFVLVMLLLKTSSTPAKRTRVLSKQAKRSCSLDLVKGQLADLPTDSSMYR